MTTQIIQALYDGVWTKIRFGNYSTGWLNMDRGLKHRCVLSPILFALHIAGLADALSESGEGAKVGGTCVPAIFFVDDVALMAESVAGLMRLPNMAAVWGCEMGMESNAAKSGVMASNSLLFQTTLPANSSKLLQPSAIIDRCTAYDAAFQVEGSGRSWQQGSREEV